jgi:hypothetical protein
MRILAGLLVCAFGLATWHTPWTAAGQREAKPQGTVVTLDGLKSRTPAEWEPEKPANRLRSHQFRLPRAKGDKEDAQLAILPELPGTPEANIERWKGMFEPPAGKTIEDVAHVDKLKVGPARIMYLDVHGTYLSTDRPLAAKSTAKPLPGYRMFAVMVQTKDDSFLIRAIGPAATLARHKAAFDAWLKNFKSASGE